MMLFVNGDSHTAAAEAVNCHAFAEDDPELFYMGRAPHPDNLAVSWGKILSKSLRAGFHCAAESASSNARILRTTRDWLENNRYDKDVLVVIQWSTWEREEWYDNETNTWFQVNASGIDHVPEKWHQRYKEYVAGVDWQDKTEQAFVQLREFSTELLDRQIPHIFFNGNSDFGRIRMRPSWDRNYIDPYEWSFDSYLKQNGFETVAPNSWHFGKDAHSFFARFMLQYIIDNKFI